MTKGSRATDQKGDTEKQKGGRADSVDFREIRKDRWVEFAVKSKVVVHNKSCDGFLVRASVMAYPVMANIL